MIEANDSGDGALALTFFAGSMPVAIPASYVYGVDAEEAGVTHVCEFVGSRDRGGARRTLRLFGPRGPRVVVDGPVRLETLRDGSRIRLLVDALILRTLAAAAPAAERFAAIDAVS